MGVKIKNIKAFIIAENPVLSWIRTCSAIDGMKEVELANISSTCSVVKKFGYLIMRSSNKFSTNATIAGNSFIKEAIWPVT